MIYMSHNADYRRTFHKFCVILVLFLLGVHRQGELRYTFFSVARTLPTTLLS